VTAALAWGNARGVWVRTPAAAAEVAVRGVREIVELSRRPLLGEPLQRALLLGPPRIAAADIPAFGSATVAAFASKNASPVGIAWGVHGADLVVAAGDDAPKLLSAGGSPAAHLGDDARVARALAALGSDAVFALVVQPLRFDPVHADAASAPAVFAWGRRAGAAWARVEVADALVREVVHLTAGL
jgi:hypothetical protein